jgi:hypothetical protein
MHIPVHYQNTLFSHFLGMARRDRDVVEYAKSHTLCRRCVMPRRPYKGKSRIPVIKDGINRGYGAPCCSKRHIVGIFA